MWRQGLRFIIATNLVALVYGLTSEFGLASILAAFLIESLLIGVFTTLVLIRKTLFTGRTLAGLGAITIFTLPFFGSIFLVAAFPMLMMEAFPTDKFQATADGFEALNRAAGGMTPGLFFGYFFSIIGQYCFEVLRFFVVYHWPVSLGMSVIYGYEFLKERPTAQILESNAFSAFITKPFLRMLFTIYGPYFAGFLLYLQHVEGSGPLSWEMNIMWVTILTVCKFCLDSWRLRRRTHHSEPPIMDISQPMRYGAMERNDRRIEFKLEDTFTY